MKRGERGISPQPKHNDGVNLIKYFDFNFHLQNAEGVVGVKGDPIIGPTLVARPKLIWPYLFPRSGDLQIGATETSFGSQKAK